MGTIVLQIERQGVTGNKFFLHFSGVGIGGPTNGHVLIHPIPDLCRAFARCMEFEFAPLQLGNALASEIRQQSGKCLANRRAALIAPEVVVTHTIAHVSVLSEISARSAYIKKAEAISLKTSISRGSARSGVEK